MQQLRVDSAGLQTMAGQWGASVSELDATVAPTRLGLRSQASAASVNAAHADVTAFTAALATRVGTGAIQVGEVDTRYLANEAESANEMTAVGYPATGV
jgi:hypothetical protein